MSDKNIAPSGPEDGERDGILLGIARTLLENLHWGIPWLIVLSILPEWCLVLAGSSKEQVHAIRKITTG